jgi:hypothetical protein
MDNKTLVAIEKRHKQKIADAQKVIDKLFLVRVKLARLEMKPNFENRNRDTFYKNLNKRIDNVLKMF